MRLKIVYIASDGSEFDNEVDCVAHDSVSELYREFLNEWTFSYCGDTILRVEDAAEFHKMVQWFQARLGEN